MYSKIAVKCYWWPFWQDFPTIQKNWQWCIEKTLVSLLTTSHLIPFCEKNLCLDQKKNNSRKWNIILWFWTFSSLKSKNHTYKSISLSIQPKPELNLSPMCIPWKLSEKDKKLCLYRLRIKLITTTGNLTFHCRLQKQKCIIKLKLKVLSELLKDLCFFQTT